MLRKNLVSKGVAVGFALAVMLGMTQTVEAAAKDVYSVVTLEAENHDDGYAVGNGVVLSRGDTFTYGNTTVDTVWTCYDWEGRKTVITNKDSKGNKVYEEAELVTSKLTQKNGGDYDFLRLKKGDAYVYINGDGTYFGGSALFYKHSEMLTQELILMSNDKTNYKLINNAGKTCQNISGYKSAEVFGDYVGIYYVAGQNEYYEDIVNCMMIDEKGNKVSIISDVDRIQKDNAGYYKVTRKNGKSIQIYDADFNLMFDMEGYEEDYNLCDDATKCLEGGYMVLELKQGYDDVKMVLVDRKTNKIVGKYWYIYHAENGVAVVEKQRGIIQVEAIGGKVYLTNLTTAMQELAGLDSRGNVEYKKYTEGYLYVVVEEKETYILSKDKGFSTSSAKKLNGFYISHTENGKYFYTNCNYNQLCILAKADGTIVKDFGSDSIYSNTQTLKDTGNMQQYILQTNVKDKDGYAYVTDKGVVSSKVYGSFYKLDNYLEAKQKNGYYDIIDGNQKIVLSLENRDYKAENAFGMLKVSNNKLYASDGTLIYSNDDADGGIVVADDVSAKQSAAIMNYHEDGRVYTVGASMIVKEKSTFTGLKQIGSNWYVFESGKITGKYNGLMQYGGSWWFIKNSKIDFSYTGLASHGGSWWYIKNGKLDFGYTGLCKYGSSWYYVNKGMLDWKYTGLCKYGSSWYYVKKGVLDWNYTGLCKYGSSWYYVNKGVLNWNYTGLSKYNGSWYYVKKGVVDFSYTGLCQYGGSWYYVKNGVLNWNYTGLCKYGSSWYYVNKGVLKWNYTGLCKYGSSWYYVSKGVVNFGYTGLCQYGGSWYYINKGVLNWNYTGLCKHGSSWYYVSKGVLNWNYTGYTTYGGAKWYVKAGVMKYKA